MFSCVLSCEEETALSIIDPTSALIELNNARRPKGRKTTGLLDIAEELLPSLEVSRKNCEEGSLKNCAFVLFHKLV